MTGENIGKASGTVSPDGFIRVHNKGNETSFVGNNRWAQGKELIQGASKNGTYLNWNWDGEKLSAYNDRYGMYPLYYAELADGIVLSTSFSEALKHVEQPRLDYEALSVYLRLGHLIGDDTPVVQVNLLPPNSTLLWRDKKLTIKTEPVDGCFAASSSISYDDAIDGYNHYFANAISRRLPGDEKFTVPISGGRDSRHIMFEMCKQGVVPPVSHTLQYRPPATNEDERVGSLICQRLGIKHNILGRPDDWFDVVYQEIFLSNFTGGGHSWILPMADYLNENNYQITYDGLAGDIISAGHAMDNESLSLIAEGKFETLAKKMLKASGKEGINAAAFSGEFTEKASFDVAMARLTRELAKYADSGNPLMAFTFWNRTRRAIGSIPFSILSGVPVVHCPYIDNDFFDFCTNLDPKFSINKPFHDDVIRRAYPQWADIPYEDKSRTAHVDADCRRYYRKSVFKFIAYLLKRRGQHTDIMDKRYIRNRVLKNLLIGVNEQPWYLRTSLYMYELENLLHR